MAEGAESRQSLSVVVITVEGPVRLRQCLAALRAQDAAPAEILAPWDPARGDTASLQREFPEVRFLHAGCAHWTYARLRTLGVSQAKGSMVALTEDHFTPAADWCRQIVAAHAAPHAAIGGAVEKDTPDKALNWAFYFADYLRYLDPCEGPSPSLTDGNVTYKRTALMEIAGVWQAEFHENLVHRALASRGESLWLSPRIVVRQKRDVSFREAVYDRYAFGRLFGSTRVEGLSTIDRVKLALACGLLPPVLVSRVIQHVLRTGRYRAALLRTLPALCLLSTIWAWGEFAGYCTGRPEKTLAARAQ
ncbi:MAG: glycosyltransferase [Candidatus Solibacter sp.]